MKKQRVSSTGPEHGPLLESLNEKKLAAIRRWQNATTSKQNPQLEKPTPPEPTEQQAGAPNQNHCKWGIRHLVDTAHMQKLASQLKRTIREPKKQNRYIRYVSKKV